MHASHGAIHSCQAEPMVSKLSMSRVNCQGKVVVVSRVSIVRAVLYSST